MNPSHLEGCSYFNGYYGAYQILIWQCRRREFLCPFIKVKMKRLLCDAVLSVFQFGVLDLCASLGAPLYFIPVSL